MSDVKLGDILWMVERHGNQNQGQQVSVTKVGRKWAYISTIAPRAREVGRIDLGSWNIDGGQYTSPGRCFRSEQEYEERLLIAREWENLRSLFNSAYRKPEHLTVPQMRSIRSMVLPPVAVKGPAA